MLNDLTVLYSEHLALFAGSVFVLGLVIGSFLNVVIYRLPIMLEREWQAQAADLRPAAHGADLATSTQLHSATDRAVAAAAQARSATARAADVATAEMLPSSTGAPNPAPPQPLPPTVCTANAAPAQPLAAAVRSLDTAAAETPARFTLSVPRSACPHCNAPITAWQNIPVLSWLILQGRCAVCHGKISARYPLVELTTGLLSAWVAWHFGFGATAACALIVTWSLIALTGIDIDHQLLPDGITLPLLWLGLLAAVVIGPQSQWPLPVSPADSIIGAAAGYLSLWLVFHAFRLVTGKEGMGYGDFKLFAALGAWLGWKLLPLVILFSAATGAVLGILMIVLRGRDRAAPMPFGPYLAAAGWLAMMYGEPLMKSYLRLSGLQH